MWSKRYKSRLLLILRMTIAYKKYSTSGTIFLTIQLVYLMFRQIAKTELQTVISLYANFSRALS